MNSKDNKRILFLLVFLMFLLVAPIIYLTYFTVFKADDIVKHPANRRSELRENSVKRGTFYDRNHEVLAYSNGEKYNYHRIYNQPIIYSHIIGYSDKIVDKYGLEKELNDYLVGKEGSKLLKTFKSIINKNYDPYTGDDITLTTDTELQEKTRSVLSANSDKGSVVIMNPKTGEVLSMVSLPDFNSQNIAQDMQKINEANNGALFNSATKGKFAPGSVYKIVTTTAILESGISQKYTDEGVEKIDNGREFKNAENKSYGRVDLRKAFTNSLNTYFARKSVDMGIDIMGPVSEKYMINKKVNFELPLETSTWTYKRNGFDRTALAAGGIGHDTILVTPLEMCMIASTIANDGVMMQPHLVKKIDSSDGKNVVRNTPTVLSEVTSKENADLITRYMVNVVNNGTGTEAYVSGIKVAGKTGTAQLDLKEGTNNAWFVGFAPADDPKVAISVVIPNVKDYGSQAAAPIAGELLKYAVKNLQLEEEWFCVYKEKFVTAIVAAAGMGKRMKMGINKQFLTIDGIPILAHTIKKIEKSKYVDFLILIVKESDMIYVDDIIEKYKINMAYKIVYGGKERQDSINNGLLNMPNETDIVLTHDGARPFVSVHKIDEAIESVMDTGACVLANPVKDTIKVSTDGETVDYTPNRDRLWQVQTPQVFKKEIIMKAYSQAYSEGYYGTDDCSLVEKTGVKVKLIYNSYDNIKITTREDLSIAQILVKKVKIWELELVMMFIN